MDYPECGFKATTLGHSRGGNGIVCVHGCDALRTTPLPPTSRLTTSTHGTVGAWSGRSGGLRAHERGGGVRAKNLHSNTTERVSLQYQHVHRFGPVVRVKSETYRNTGLKPQIESVVIPQDPNTFFFHTHFHLRWSGASSSMLTASSSRTRPTAACSTHAQTVTTSTRLARLRTTGCTPTAAGAWCLADEG